MTEHSIPSSCGFSMPAEWELHEATWLSWPHNEETWIGYKIEDVEAVYGEMIEALVTGETVRLLVNNEAMQERASQLLSQKQVDLEKVQFFTLPTNDAWIRDYGPTWLSRETETGGTETAAAIWQFNVWGNKYDYPLDITAGQSIADIAKARSFSADFVMEGGSIEVNGRGTAITTKQCLLDSNRNEDANLRIMEQRLKEFLGVTHIIWCEGEIEGDDTDGHIDNLARFIDHNTLVVIEEKDTADKNHASLKKNLEILRSEKDQDGKELTIIPIPTPGLIRQENDRLPASYANFYIGNNVVLLPVFGHKNDKEAENIIKSHFTDREVVSVDGRVLVSGLGGPHCLTQQQPIQFDF